MALEPWRDETIRVARPHTHHHAARRFDHCGAASPDRRVGGQREGAAPKRAALRPRHGGRERGSLGLGCRGRPAVPVAQDEDAGRPEPGMRRSIRAADWRAQDPSSTPTTRPASKSALEEHFEGRTPRYECEYRVRHADGSWRWLLARGRCLRDSTGRPVRFVGSAMDVTAQKQAQIDKEAARGAAAAIAENGGDRHAGRRHRPRLQQHPWRHPRLRRARAAGILAAERPAALPGQCHARDRAGEDAGGAHSRIQPQRARRSRAGERPGRHRGDARAARGIAARPEYGWSGSIEPGMRR